MTPKIFSETDCDIRENVVDPMSIRLKSENDRPLGTRLIHWTLPKYIL
jgi:hypothetical protein